MSKNILKTIHNMLVNDGYMPSFIDLCQLELVNTNTFDLIYYHISRNIDDTPSPDIIFQMQINPVDAFIYLSTHDEIKDDIFNYIKCIGFGINNTRFSYADINKNNPYNCINVFENYSNYDNGLTINSEDISKFISLYTKNKNYIATCQKHIQVFLNDITVFLEKFKNILNTYGLTSTQLNIANNGEYSGLGELYFTKIDGDDTLLYLYYDLASETTKIYGYLNSVAYNKNVVTIYDVNKITEAQAKALIKHSATSINNNYNLSTDEVNPKYVSYVYQVIYELSCKCGDELEEYLPYVIWEILPHTPKMKAYIKNNIDKKYYNLITDSYFKPE